MQPLHSRVGLAPKSPREGSQTSLPQLWKEGSIRDSGAGVSSAQLCSAPQGLLRALPRGTCFNQDFHPYIFQEERQDTHSFLAGCCHLHSLLHSPEHMRPTNIVAPGCSSPGSLSLWLAWLGMVTHTWADSNIPLASTCCRSFMCWVLHHFLELPRMFMTIYLEQSNMYIKLQGNLSSDTDTETCAFYTRRHRTAGTPGNSQHWIPMNKEGGSLKHACHCTCEGQTEAKSKQQNKEPVTLSLPTLGCSLLWPNLVPSSCLLKTRNAHLFPLIKGIIIYNFLLKNQLCTLSIAGRNSHFVTWLEKIDQNSRLWKEKKTSKIIYLQM